MMLSQMAAAASQASAPRRVMTQLPTDRMFDRYNADGEARFPARAGNRTTSMYAAIVPIL